MSSHGAVDSVSQMDASTPFELGESYDAFPRIEEEFQAALDESLIPRGPDLLFGLVGDLRLPAAARVIDVGCGEGRYALELAERFGFVVRGIDPMESHLELAGDELATATSVRPELRGQVSFELGTAEALPVEDASVDSSGAATSWPTSESSTRPMPSSVGSWATPSVTCRSSGRRRTTS